MNDLHKKRTVLFRFFEKEDGFSPKKKQTETAGAKQRSTEAMKKFPKTKEVISKTSCFQKDFEAKAAKQTISAEKKNTDPNGYSVKRENKHRHLMGNRDG